MLRKNLLVLTTVALLIFSLSFISPITSTVTNYLVIRVPQDQAGNTAGTTNPAPGTHNSSTYPTYCDVTALPDSGYRLEHWELDGSNVGSANPYRVYMDGNHTLEAYFRPRVTIGATSGGTTTPIPGWYYYSAGTSVAVTAKPDTGCTFHHWELNGSNVGSTNPYTLSNIQTNNNLTAVFRYWVYLRAYCYIHDVGQSVSVTMDGSPSGYNTPHNFTDMQGPHEFSVPSTDTHGHSFLRWSNGLTSRTFTNPPPAKTYTAYYWTASPNPQIFVTPSSIVDGYSPGDVMTVKVNVSSTPSPGLWSYNFYMTANTTVFPPVVPMSNMNFTTDAAGWSTTAGTATSRRPDANWPGATPWNLSTNAYLSDGKFANTTVNGATQQYGNYGFSISGGATIYGVLAGVKGYTAGDEKIALSVSWNGGVSWAPEQNVTLGTTNPTYPTYYEFTEAISWTPDMLNNHFRTRVRAVQNGTTMSYIYLDWLPARVLLAPEPNTAYYGYDGIRGNPPPGSGVGSYYQRANATGSAMPTIVFTTERSFTWSLGTPLSASLSYALNITGNSFGATDNWYEIRVVKPSGKLELLKGRTTFTGNVPWTYTSISAPASAFAETGTYKIQLRASLKTGATGATKYVRINWDDVGLELAPVNIVPHTTLSTGGGTYFLAKYFKDGGGYIYVSEAITAKPYVEGWAVPGNYTLVTIRFLVGSGSTKLDLYNTKLMTLDALGNSVQYDHTAVDGYFPRLEGDVDGDRDVDKSDLSALSVAYGSDSTKPNWNACYYYSNFNGDNKIDALDLIKLGKNFNKKV